MREQYDPARHLRALCCACGSLRHLNRKRYNGTPSDFMPTNGYSPTGDVPAGWGDLRGHWSHQQRKPEHLRSMSSVYDRMVCLASCDQCGERTRHAMIFSETYSNRDQLEDDMLHNRLGKPIL